MTMKEEELVLEESGVVETGTPKEEAKKIEHYRHHVLPFQMEVAAVHVEPVLDGLVLFHCGHILDPCRGRDLAQTDLCQLDHVAVAVVAVHDHVAIHDLCLSVHGLGLCHHHGNREEHH